MLTAKHAAHPGLDVDKQLHWTYAVDSAGAVLLSRRVANTEAGLDSAIAECPKDTLVVVDQRRSIGALAFRRVRAAERPVARLPGSAEHEPAKDFPGIAKTDERDAADLAPGASGRPRARRRADNVDSGRLGAEGPHGMRERAAFQAAVVLPRVRARLRDGRAVVRRHALRARRALEHARHRPREVLRRLARAAAASGARADESRRSTPWPPKCTTPSASLCASSPTTKKKRGGGAPEGHRRVPFGQRRLRQPADHTGDRAEDGGAARCVRGRIPVRQPRQARQLLRADPVHAAVRDIHRLRQRASRQEQAVEEPARALMQLADQIEGVLRRILQEVPGQKHEAQVRAQSHRAQEDEGDLRRHARRHAVFRIDGAMLDTLAPRNRGAAWLCSKRIDAQ